MRITKVMVPESYSLLDLLHLEKVIILLEVLISLATFATILSIQLQILGLKPTTVSVDDYYKSHEDCPRDENGGKFSKFYLYFKDYDFERLDALRVDLLNKHIADLLAGKEVICFIFIFNVSNID